MEGNHLNVALSNKGGIGPWGGWPYQTQSAVRDVFGMPIFAKITGIIGKKINHCRKCYDQLIDAERLSHWLYRATGCFRHYKDMNIIKIYTKENEEHMPEIYAKDMLNNIKDQHTEAQARMSETTRSWLWLNDLDAATKAMQEANKGTNIFSNITDFLQNTLGVTRVMKFWQQTREHKVVIYLQQTYVASCHR